LAEDVTHPADTTVKLVITANPELGLTLTDPLVGGELIVMSI
jgi:hypothetical protein